MEADEVAGFKESLRELGEYMLDPKNVPRHPRGFKGRLEYVDVIMVVQARDPSTGKIYIVDPVELQPDQGETKEPDVFARDYATVGTRRGTSLIDVVFKLVPILTGAGGGAAAGGGWMDVLGSLFGKKR